MRAQLLFNAAPIVMYGALRSLKNKGKKIQIIFSLFPRHSSMIYHNITWYLKVQCYIYSRAACSDTDIELTLKTTTIMKRMGRDTVYLHAANISFQTFKENVAV